MSKPVKVMIVDDSAVVRMVVSELLSTDKGIEVIATASDPLFALGKMQQQWPDVIVLDVEMPRMDGITFLNQLMNERPTPVVICSTLTVKGAETTMQALAAGAVSVVAKPTIGLKQYLQDESDSLIAVVKAAAKANLKHLSKSTPAPAAQPRPAVDTVLPAASNAMPRTTDRIVAIGTSTGGVQALERILTALPSVCPGVVVVQHMPEKFTEAFAKRLNSLCRLEVKEAVTGDRVIPGRALIAPGGRHMLLKRDGAHYHVDIVAGPPVSRHCPSVDVLFRSVAKTAGDNALGVIMTGMGDDGAKGLKEMLEAGAHTLGQDEESCVVYGMPAAARRLGAVQHEVPLHSIPGEIVAFGKA